MKTLIGAACLCMALFIGLSSFQQEENYSNTLERYYSNWGEHCPKCGDLSPKSYIARFRNKSKEKLDVRIAMQKDNKKWDVFSFSALAPNDTLQVCVCSGTSKLMKWAKKTGDNVTTMPTEQEINNQY